MKFALSSTLVRNSLSSHSWIGLLTGFFMYLICLSGTLVVFAPYLEDWEQPDIPELQTLAPAQAAKAYNELLVQAPDISGDVLIMLPRTDMPRASLISSEGAWLINQDGSKGGSIHHSWKDMITNLHLFLHLPTSFGMIVVSSIGALLCSLIISGFLSHPRIFRDAFNFRIKGSRHLEQADLHNRLSVWGAPFHLMIAITGAYFGLAALMYSLFANAYFDGDEEAVIEAIFGAAPALEQQVKPANIEKALNEMPSIAPEASAFYVTIEDVNTPEQYILLGAHHPERLIYAEQYRFDQDGNYLDNAGYLDGEIGQQTIFSVFRIHFGHFGGFPVMVLFGVFGLALSIVSVTGINIWLAKRKSRDSLNNIWAGLVWGTPLALACTALVGVIFQLNTQLLFWLTLVLSVGLAQWLDNEKVTKTWLLYLSALLLFALTIGHIIVYKTEALNGVALIINIVILCSALVFILMGRSAVEAVKREV